MNEIPLTTFADLTGRYVHLVLIDGTEHLEKIVGIESGKVIVWPGFAPNFYIQSDILEVQDLDRNVIAITQRR